MNETDLLEKAEDALRACLAEIPFLRLEEARKQVRKGRNEVDLLLRVALPNEERTLVCEFKNSGQPKTVRDATYQLLQYLQLFPNATGVLVAPYVSPAAAAILTTEGIGYVDLAGNCRLSFGQVYIQKEGKPNPFSEKRDLRSMSSPKASRVLRVLLNNPTKNWKIEALAREAEVSLGQAFNVKKLLLDREWIRTSLEGFALEEPWSLLEEWSANYELRRSLKWDLFSFKSVGEIESSLAEICAREGIKYAFTGFSGAERLAPFVRYQRATAYLDADERGILKLSQVLDLRRVPSGANVSLWNPRDQGVFYSLREFNGIRTVSPIQVYLDLRALGGRGEDAANFLLETVLKPGWK